MNHLTDPPSSAEPQERWFVVVVGLIALAAALICTYIGALYLPSLGADSGSTFFAVFFLAAGLFSGYVAFRLLNNVPRNDGGLLPPSGVVIGSILLAICTIFVTLISRDAPIWLTVLSVLGAVSLLAGGWQLAKWRKGKNAT